MGAKEKQRLAIAIGLAVVVLAALWFFVLRKPKQEEQTAQAPGAAAPGRVPSAPGAKIPGRGPLGPAAPFNLAAPGIGAAAVKGAAGVAPAPGAPPAALAKATPLYPPRPDPFEPLFKPPPPPKPKPPPPPLALVQVGPPLVMAQALPEQVMMVQEQTESPGRTSGVMWNDRVYAILEKPDNTSAVLQPGDTLDGDTVRSISPEGIVLAHKGGGEIKVSLRARQGGAVPATTAPAQPELPGAPAAQAY